MESGLRIGRILGIPVHLHPTWFVVWVLVVLGLWTSLLGAFPDLGAPQRIGVALVISLLLFGSVFLHELGHALVARRHRVRVRSITLFLFGGVAWMEREPETARAELAIAAAGPAVSAALAAAFWLAAGGFDPGSPGRGTFRWLGVLNAGIAAFNLLPGFPLDGGRALRAALWRRDGDPERATRVAARVGQGIAYALVAGGAALAWTSPVAGVWLAFLGWFVLTASATSGRDASARISLRGLRARDVMSPHVQTVEADVVVGTVARDQLLRGERWALVMRNGEPLGIVTRTDVRRLPPERWPDTAVLEIATPMDRLVVAAPDLPLHRVLELLTEGRHNQIPVVDGALIVGSVTRQGILDAMAVRGGRPAAP
jgi:Zn-dependent protease/predicted transcriptional regulator